MYSTALFMLKVRLFLLNKAGKYDTNTTRIIIIIPFVNCILKLHLLFYCFHFFYIRTTVFPPSSLSVPSPTLSLHFPIHSSSVFLFFFRKWQAFHRCQQSMAFQVEVGLNSSHCTKAG